MLRPFIVSSYEPVKYKAFCARLCCAPRRLDLSIYHPLHSSGRRFLSYVVPLSSYEIKLTHSCQRMCCRRRPRLLLSIKLQRTLQQHSILLIPVAANVTNATPRSYDLANAIDLSQIQWHSLPWQPFRACKLSGIWKLSKKYNTHLKLFVSFPRDCPVVAIDFRLCSKGAESVSVRTKNKAQTDGGRVWTEL